MVFGNDSENSIKSIDTGIKKNMYKSQSYHLILKSQSNACDYKSSQ